MPDTLASFSAIVASVYDAALNPPSWTDALSRIRTLFGANGVHLLISRPNMPRLTLISDGWDSAQDRKYDQYYWRIDPIVPHLERMATGTILTSRDTTSSKQRYGEFFNDWANPNDVGDTIFVNVLRDNRAFGATICIGAPWRSSPFFNTEKSHLLKLLVPHLQHALKAQCKLGEVGGEHAYTLQALDCQRHGFLLLESTGKVIYINRAAAEIIAQADGLRISGGRLEAAIRTHDNRLQQIIRHLTRVNAEPRFGGTAMIARPSGRRPFMVVSLPLRSTPLDFGMIQASSLLQIIDPEIKAGFSTLHLQEHFGLTAAEAKVAIRILHGYTLQDAAKDLSVTLSTVRIHLQRIFEKTQTHRQADLIRLLLDIQLVI